MRVETGRMRTKKQYGQGAYVAKRQNFNSTLSNSVLHPKNWLRL